MDKIIKQPYLLDDGRKAEKVVQVAGDAAGETKIVTELWEEPKVEKRLMQRVIEYKKPLVYKREVEVLGENGEVVDRQIENLDETVVEPVVAAMSAPVSGATESPITRAELTEALKTVVTVLRSPAPVQTPEPKISAFSLLESKVEQKKATSESWKWYLIIAAAGSAVGFIVFIL